MCSFNTSGEYGFITFTMYYTTVRNVVTHNKCGTFLVVQGIIAEKGLDVKLSGGNVIPSLNGSI